MKRLIIVGGGFAGMWAALAAARVADRAGSQLEITLISSDEFLVIRPRLYEPTSDRFRISLRPVLETAGVRLIEGTVTGIDAVAHRADCTGGETQSIEYDQLVLTTGSRLWQPPVPGLAEHSWNVDSYDASLALNRHLTETLVRSDDTAARTVVVVGGGFTGIEVVTALRSRLANLTSGDIARAARIVLVDRNGEVGHELGPNPRPLIEQALASERVELKMGRSVDRVSTDALWLSDGERIATRTVVSTIGMVAQPLGKSLGAACDDLGRLLTDAELRVVDVPDVFAAGDAAHAVLNDAGQAALMCCQHAITMGKFAGHNAAGALLGQPLRAYRQPYYVTCLDLGPMGAMLSTGWQRTVRLEPEPAKSMKLAIMAAIDPPLGTRAQLLDAAGIEQDNERFMEDFIARLGGRDVPLVATV